jgi:hypothetical protein
MLAHSHRRRGQVALVSVFAIMTLLLLIAALLNAARVTSRKLDTQNAADAAAHAAGVEMARGMNAVTALNHLIAELNALDAMVMAFGGIPLEDRKPISIVNPDLVDAYAEALRWNGGTLPDGFRIVRTLKSKSGAAIGDSRKRLQRVLTEAYRVHAAGGVMCMENDIAPFAPSGRELIKAANVIERNVVFEWEVLDYLEELAEGPLLGLKHLCNPMRKPDGSVGLITLLYEYSERVVEETPHRAEHAAAAVAQQLGTTGSLFPNTRGGRFTLELPVVKEKITRHTVTHRHSQMVRGMTPWVQYWRKPILAFGRATLPLSGFARHYHDATNDFTLNMAWWQWLENRTHLYVLKDLDVRGPDKGREPWAVRDGSHLADARFALVGFAHQPMPEVVGAPVFRPYQPDGLAAHAQVLLYNANPQNRPRQRQWQPVVGWDTLAWDNAVPEFEFGEDYGSDREIREQPRIKLNWQVKLVPTTRLADAAGTQHPELNRILDRTTADRPLANTH